MGLDVDSNDIVTAAYTCFTRNDTEYCLKGGDEAAYDTNKTLVSEAFKDVEIDCHSGNNVYSCDVGSFIINIFSLYSEATNGGGTAKCQADTSFGCFEYSFPGMP